MAKTQLGNGTYTTNVYDAAGEVKSLVNFAPDGSVNSRFDYTYDLLGRPITEKTLDGQWTYQYDAFGNLTGGGFSFPSNPSLTPNENLQYVYDAAGNRTQTTINGATTTYTINDLNQVTAAGSTSFVYDPVGNLILQTDPSGTTTFTYNAANQLTSIKLPDGSTATYQYDALGYQVASEDDGQNNRLADRSLRPRYGGWAIRWRRRYSRSLCRWPGTGESSRRERHDGVL